MESWVIILLSVGFMIISAVSKNKKEKEKRAARNQGHGREEEEMSIPDIFSTIFGFEEPKHEQKREIVEAEPENFHQQFEEVVLEEVETESLNSKYGGEVVVDAVESPSEQEAVENDEILYGAIPQRYREKIDPRKMIIYSELLKPKFKEV